MFHTIYVYHDNATLKRLFISITSDMGTEYGKKNGVRVRLYGYGKIRVRCNTNLPGLQSTTHKSDHNKHFQFLSCFIGGRQNGKRNNERSRHF